MPTIPFVYLFYKSKYISFQQLLFISNPHISAMEPLPLNPIPDGNPGNVQPPDWWEPDEEDYDD